jgi:RNA polymerase sigma factor (sigma-70 family)
MGGRKHDVDDVLQEAYCRLAALESSEHIDSGRAYLFRTARNIVLEQARRSRIVRIENSLEVECLNIPDGAPTPEQVVTGIRELQRVQRLIEALPTKCRRVFVLRRIHGVSQREIARMFGISENTVEMQAVKGLKLLMKAMEGEDAAKDTPDDIREGSRNRA